MNELLEKLNVIKGTCQHLKLLSSGELKAFEDIENALKEKQTKTIYRKLKDYIKHEDGCITHIFGDFMSRECRFDYEDKNGKWQEWFGVGVYGHEMDFLLDYYVAGVNPKYKIERDKIIQSFPHF